MGIPIPKRPCGYRRGSPSAIVQVEAFLDVECSFSRRAWKTLLELTDTYSPGDVSLLVQPIAMPYHRQAWDATRCLHVVAGGDDEMFFEFASHLFEYQHLFRGDAFRSKTLEDLEVLLADLAHAHCHMDRHVFLHKLRSDEIVQATKAPIRYAASRGVWSTPSFFINSAEVLTLLPKSSVSDWKLLLGPLLEENF